MYARTLVAGSASRLNVLLNHARAHTAQGGKVDVLLLSNSDARLADLPAAELRAQGYGVNVASTDGDSLTAIAAWLDANPAELVVFDNPSCKRTWRGGWRRLEREVFARSGATLVVRGDGPFERALLPRAITECQEDVSSVVEVAGSAEVVLLRCAPVPLNAGALRAHVDDCIPSAERIHEELASTRTQCEAAGVATREVVSTAEVSDAILKAAKDTGADLICLTDYRPASLLHRLLGSKVSRILSETSASVLVRTPNPTTKRQPKDPDDSAELPRASA